MFKIFCFVPLIQLMRKWWVTLDLLNLDKLYLGIACLICKPLIREGTGMSAQLVIDKYQHTSSSTHLWVLNKGIQGDVIVPTREPFLETFPNHEVSELSISSCWRIMHLPKSLFILFDLEMAHEFSLLTLLHGVYPLFCAESVLPTSFLLEREQTLDFNKDACI